MTHRVDVAGGRDIVGRWCAFAEQRLEYLTELFETGRWRRFYTEQVFLENIREAKAAVEVWRGLATRGASPDSSAVDISWPARVEAARPPGDTLPARVQWPPPKLVEASVESPPFDVSVATDADHVFSDEAPPAPHADMPSHASPPVLSLDTIEARYPLLRNAL